MKKTTVLTLILAVILISLISVFSTKDSSAGDATCSATIYLLTSANNCQGVRCGPTGRHNFTTDSNGDFVLDNLCVGTYTFCVPCAGGGKYVVVVTDGGAYVADTPTGGSCCPIE